MGEFIDAWKAIVVECSSEDQLVKVTRQNETKVELHPNARAEYDESTLARQIEDLYVEANECHAEAVSELIASRRGRKALEASRDSRKSVKNQRYVAEISATRVEAKSSNGVVRAEMFGDGDLILQIERRAFNSYSMSHEALVREINDSIAKAHSELRQRARRIDERVNKGQADLRGA